MNHFAIQHKLMKYYKSTILQLKKKVFKYLGPGKELYDHQSATIINPTPQHGPKHPAKTR